MLHAAKTAWSGVFADRGDHERRTQGLVDRAAVAVTVKYELAILAETLAGAVRKVLHGSLPRRFQLASRNNVTSVTILDILPTFTAVTLVCNAGGGPKPPA
jgi:hypothetical protein